MGRMKSFRPPGMSGKADAVKEAMALPLYDTLNRQGYPAYGVGDELRLLAMLNTLKLQSQFYRTVDETFEDLRDTLWAVASKDAYLAAQMIVWSRCLGEGMRSICHAAAAMLAPFASGTTWASRFYSAFDTTTKSGGCVYRLDDMSEIKDAYVGMTGKGIPNAMRKGFKKVLEGASEYSLCKYRKTSVDMANLTHPDPKKCAALKTSKDGDVRSVVSLLVSGEKLKAETWETKMSALGEKYKGEVLRNEKGIMWRDLLKENKLGILAIVRNMRNILLSGNTEAIELACAAVQDGARIKAGKIMPYQMDLAAQAILSDRAFAYGLSWARLDGVRALDLGMESALPNLKDRMPGKSLVMLDCSGSMWSGVKSSNGVKVKCIDHAATAAALLCKGVDADVIRFGSSAEYVQWDPSCGVRSIAKSFKSDMGRTDLSSAFKLITGRHASYNRIFILSDTEVNEGDLLKSYRDYILNVCSPYIYVVDFGAYGSAPVPKTEKVGMYYGYGYAMFEDVSRMEFNPDAKLGEVRSVRI